MRGRTKDLLAATAVGFAIVIVIVTASAVGKPREERCISVEVRGGGARANVYVDGDRVRIEEE